MMRIGFLPSDFNPMILLVGEAEDIRALGGVLRRFARDGAAVEVGSLGFCTAAGIALRLVADEAAPGVHRDGGGFIWAVPADQAAAFADRLDELGAPGRIAGSEQLDCGTEDGIAIKVSRGEYTDDFLAR
jgi:dienelactone hydrolase